MSKFLLAITFAATKFVFAEGLMNSVAKSKENNSLRVYQDSDSLGVLQSKEFGTFKTTLYGLKYHGKLLAKQKLPFLVLSGRGCQSCDANRTIYIHSPADGPMNNESKLVRYSFPGKEKDYQTQEEVYESRLFIGQCISLFPNAAIWFEREKYESKVWQEHVYIVQVIDEKLFEKALPPEKAPSIQEAVHAVQAGNCSEVAGEDRDSEP